MATTKTKEAINKKYNVEKKYYRAKDVAKYLSIGLSTVWDMAKKGRITPIKLSQKVTVFHKQELDSLFE